MNEFDRVRDYLTGLQDRICAAVEAIDGSARFAEDLWQREEGGGGRTRILRDGAVFEQAGIGFSDVSGSRLPPSASAHRPELAGATWRACGVSLVFHPHNPHIPTTHANVRYFRAERDGDVVAAGSAAASISPRSTRSTKTCCIGTVPRRRCAPHLAKNAMPRTSAGATNTSSCATATRRVAWVACSSTTDKDFERDFAYQRAVGDGFLDAYLPIVERRKDTPYGEHEREFQLYRRGRYVEFNLVYDRGTLFGLQSGGRAESILMSLPPRVRWEYGFTPEPGSAEARLMDYLVPRDWLG